MYQQFTDKYRPKTFKDVIGQKPAVASLEGMILSNKLNPTLMLSGPYGTGKTTLARIIARYLNCETRNSCGTCKSCLAMDSGTHPDVIELNAANTRGIDDIRALIDKAYFNPRYNYRVFILDECQQLTPQAAQALLKPLEEPPKKTVWILCTTDPQKILPAIKSRSQHIKLNPIKEASITKLLGNICEKENLKFPEKALNLISGLAQGHARNAVMLLEQVQRYLAKQDKVPENLEENLPSIIEELGSLAPELVVVKYIQALLSGSYQALRIAEKADNAEFFINLAARYIKNMILFIQGVQDSPEMSYFKTFKSPYSLSSNDLVTLLELHMEALNKSKTYVIEPSDIRDLMILRSLEVVRATPKIPQAKTG